MLSADEPRVARLIARARAAFGRAPEVVTRAPGRVNLLGEHTDYNMLPVLPMAIERCLLIAAAPRDDGAVTLSNLGSFPERRYELSASIPPYAAGDWGNYSKAAAQGLADFYGRPLTRGGDLMVDGDIPSGAGLSSSSALLVANALALLALNKRTIAPETLAEILPPAERYVGTLSGGMDQAISLLAKAGHALRIDFAPLRQRPVPLPPDCSVVVCHSLVQAEKSGAAKAAYNQRVIECRLACRVLDAALHSDSDNQLSALGDLARLYPRRRLSSFVGDLARLLPETPVGLDHAAAAAATDVETLRRACAIPRDCRGPFAVLRRARHVLNEAERVDRAEPALRGGDTVGFGRLMDASHTSCREDYEVSCPELESLVALAKEFGALGARLTGAGFGGCTVNLVRSEAAERFLEQMDQRFYRHRLAVGAAVEQFRFVFSPQAGAETVVLST
jgi:N-acetylgalactosamine kinase